MISHIYYMLLLLFPRSTEALTPSERLQFALAVEDV
jgi:hypothetical protein